jgi:hypothetical protein
LLPIFCPKAVTSALTSMTPFWLGLRQPYFHCINHLTTSLLQRLNLDYLSSFNSRRCIITIELKPFEEIWTGIQFVPEMPGRSFWTNFTVDTQVIITTQQIHNCQFSSIIHLLNQRIVLL